MDDLFALSANGGLPSVEFADDIESGGLAAVTADDFMTLLITQLQYQDPTEPMTNDEILSQVSQMQQMQASVELTDVLEGLSSGQGLTSASSLIGRAIVGRDSEGSVVEGTVDRALIRGGSAVVSVGGTEVALDKIDSVAVDSDAADSDA